MLWKRYSIGKKLYANVEFFRWLRTFSLNFGGKLFWTRIIEFGIGIKLYVFWCSIMKFVSKMF